MQLLRYELLSFDETPPEVIMYWGPVDRSNNLGLWENNMSLGQKGIGVGSLQISGLTPGETVLQCTGKRNDIF